MMVHGKKFKSWMVMLRTISLLIVWIIMLFFLEPDNKAIPQGILCENLFFERGSTVLTKKLKDRLDQLCRKNLSAKPGHIALTVCKTDDVESDRDTSLTETRMRTVFAYLISKNYGYMINEIRLNNNPEPADQQEVSCYPWDQDFMEPYRNPVLKNMDKLVIGLMKNLTKYSPYLGAQRIRLELYDNPILAAFYAEMYVHYMDSIYHILKDSLNIKPGESERFIRVTSSILPVRFTYSVNFFLWQGICKNQFDCDNYSYLVYDLGKKLGMEISLVVLRSHVIAIVGEFAYETIGNSYFKKKDLEKEYDDVIMISSNRDSINALVAIYEISNFLKINGEYQKAKIFVTEGLKYFPDNPLLIKTMGDVYNSLEDYANALKCYCRANKKSPDDQYIGLKMNTARDHLLSAGKKELALSIIKKYK